MLKFEVTLTIQVPPDGDAVWAMLEIENAALDVLRSVKGPRSPEDYFVRCADRRLFQGTSAEVALANAAHHNSRVILISHAHYVWHSDGPVVLHTETSLERLRDQSVELTVFAPSSAKAVELSCDLTDSIDAVLQRPDFTRYSDVVVSGVIQIDSLWSDAQYQSFLKTQTPGLYG